jgi:hypothetical protein
MRITIDIDDKWLLYAKYQAVQQECVIFSRIKHSITRQ